MICHPSKTLHQSIISLLSQYKKSEYWDPEKTIAGVKSLKQITRMTHRKQLFEHKTMPKKSSLSTVKQYFEEIIKTYSNQHLFSEQQLDKHLKIMPTDLLYKKIDLLNIHAKLKARLLMKLHEYNRPNKCFINKHAFLLLDPGNNLLEDLWEKMIMTKRDLKIDTVSYSNESPSLSTMTVEKETKKKSIARFFKRR
jgi:hypothetical protein